LRYSTCTYAVTLKPGLGSLKVISTDTNRSAVYDFLLTFYSNHGPISYHFRDKRRFQSKSHKFPTPVFFAPTPKGLPSELGIGAGSQKTRVIWLLDRERSLTISSAIWIQYTKVTDRRTDTGRQQRPRLRRASSGKNSRHIWRGGRET